MTTGLHISFRVIMWLKNPTRILITPHSQNKHCSWTSRLSPAHRAHHMQTVTYHNSSKAPRLSTQGRLSGKQPGKPGQHITVTGNTRARAPLTRHTIPLSSISTSKLFTENVEIGVCWDQTLCQPPDIN